MTVIPKILLIQITTHYHTYYNHCRSHRSPGALVHLAVHLKGTSLDGDYMHHAHYIYPGVAGSHPSCCGSAKDTETILYGHCCCSSNCASPYNHNLISADSSRGMKTNSESVRLSETN